MAIDRVKTKANAEKFLKVGRIPEAIRELQKLADDNPRDIQVLNQIGQLHLRLGNKDLAVPSFLKVADLFSKQGFFTKAVASLKIVTREAPENLSAWEMLAGLSEQQGFAREAWSAYEKVAELCGRAGNLTGVVEVQKKLLELEPDNVKIQVQLGDNLIKGGRREEGVKHYLKAGGKLIAQGHIKEAARMYERALQLDPTHFSALEAAVKTHLSHQQGEVALQLLDILLERAPASEGILLLKADALNEQRQFSEAEKACRSAMAANPSSSGAMFRLVRALVMQQRIDDASGMVLAWLKECGPAKAGDSEALFEEILRFSAGHIGSLQGLVETARLSGQVDSLKRALGALAENASAQGSLSLARETLQELLQIEPNNLQVAEKLHVVDRKMGLSPQSPAQSPRAAVAQAPEGVSPSQSEPVDSRPRELQIDLDVVVEETGEAEIDIDMDDLNLESAEHTSSLSSQAMGVGETQVEAPSGARETSFAEETPPEQEIIPPKAKPALSAREADDIRDQLTEAEVFLKYGLVEKAVAELQAILKKIPDHIHAHQKLIAIYRTQKKGDKLLRQLLKLAAIFRSQGDEDTSAHLVDEARTIDPNHKALMEWDRVAASGGPASSSMEAGDRSASALPSQLQELILDLDLPSSRPSAVVKGAGEIDLSLGEEEPPQAIIGEIELEEEVPEAAVGQAPEEARNVVASIDLGFHKEFHGPPAEAPSEDAELAEQLEEAEFYLNQELFGEAQRALKTLEVRWPDDPAVKTFREKMAQVLPPMEEEPSASMVSASAPLEPTAELEPELPSELLADKPLLAQASTESEPLALTLDEEVVPIDVPPPVSPEEQAEAEFREQVSGARSKTKMKVSVRDLLPEEGAKAEEPLVKENEYYDLASELGAALDGLQGPEEALFDDDGKSPEEMSFEEVFEEFKKGVEKKVGEEDYATHYNLGIAYKEMDLLDEAVGEFQMAARSPQYFVECCSMLGICFRLKGLNELAEKWYRKGIAAPGFAEDVYVGLKYDLADCLAEQGRPDEANELFKEVYAIQSNYRDVKDRIKK